MKKLGTILFGIGFISMLGFAGADDSKMAHQIPTSFELLFIEIIIAIILMIIGFILIKRGEKNGS